MTTPEPDLVIRARRVVTPDGERPAAVVVRGGRISAVTRYDAAPDLATPGLAAARTVELAPDEVLLPGLVDSHVHVNEPGRTHWEGFATATRAAAAGGVTTIVDMPLNSVPPTTTPAGLAAKRAAARGQLAVDVGLWGGAVPENVAPGSTALRELHDAGVFGFKVFLSPSGIEEFGHLSPPELRAAAETIAAFDGLLIVHAEDPAVLDAAPTTHGRDYAAFLASRPDEAERAAIALVVDTARRTGVRCHILHLSSATALPLITEARADGVRLTVETCPHYLTLAAEHVPPGATPFKCCPPIRDAANRDALWRALADGVIDCVVSDHSPSTVDLKCLDTGDFAAAWGGVSGLEVGLRAVWTEAERRGHTLTDIARWMASGPADVAGLTTKGRITPGHDADLVVVAPEERAMVDATRLRHRNPVSAYDGAELRGQVRRTWLRGEPVDLDNPPRGRLLTR